LTSDDTGAARRQIAVEEEGGGLSGGFDAPGDGPHALPDLRVMLTAREAFPFLEHMFLTAQSRVSCGFRVFAPETPLVSDEARAVGESWGDLVAHTVGRGVRVSLVLSDFDPVGAPMMHRTTHRSIRLFQQAAEAAGVARGLEIDGHLHPARAGLPFRLLFAPLAHRYLARIAERLEAQGARIRDARLADSPRLARLLEMRGGRLRPRRLALPELAPCTHHQKVAVADGERLYVGGLDLDERRLDTLEHDRAAGRTWHDVALAFTGPIAAHAEAHLDAFRHEVAGRSRPPARDGFLRTLSRRRKGLGALRFGPRPVVAELHDRTREAVARAESLVYLESQFLRDVHFARALARRGREAPHLGLIVVLPAAPEDVAFLNDTGIGQRFGEHLQAKSLDILARAFGDRAAFVSPAQRRGVAPDGTRAVLCGAPIVYVHAKVSVVDAHTALVSSANLNGRSHHWDTEAGVALRDPAQVALLRDRLMAHWLPDDAGPDFYDPAHAPIAWRRLAEDNREKPPHARQGFLLPYPRGVPRRFGRPVPFLPQNLM
jgi:phospholipase D1/2